jgi:hypothetical protein
MIEFNIENLLYIRFNGLPFVIIGMVYLLWKYRGVLNKNKNEEDVNS